MASILVLNSISSFAATPPKAGATCPKVGVSQIFKGLKYACTKVGNKNVWSKGVVVQKVESGSANPTKLDSTPSPASSKSPSLASDIRITNSSLLASNSVCKTSDQTLFDNPSFTSDMSNGFPRPLGSIYGKKEGRVLIIPLSFKNQKFARTKSDFSQSSYGMKWEF